MAKLIAFTNLTLDGVMQGPAGPDEDTRDNFTLGGWAAPYNAMQSPAPGEHLANAGPILFGRRTYENFASFWPHQTGNPFTEILNNTQKYVASNTLKEPLPWVNSTLLSGDVPGALTALKTQLAQDMLVFGSGELIQSLMQHYLVDLFVLLIHPVVLGAGRRLFGDGGVPANLQLVDVKDAGNGVVMVVYQPGA